MDSNSIVVNPHGGSWKGERGAVKENQFAMATYSDNHSESDHGIAYPGFPRLRLRLDSRITALPERERERRPASSSLQEGDLFQDSLFASGAKSRPRNPWATVGSVALPPLLLLALV